MTIGVNNNYDNSNDRICDNDYDDENYDSKYVDDDDKATVVMMRITIMKTKTMSIIVFMYLNDIHIHIFLLNNSAHNGLNPLHQSVFLPVIDSWCLYFVIDMGSVDIRILGSVSQYVYGLLYLRALRISPLKDG